MVSQIVATTARRGGAGMGGMARRGRLGEVGTSRQGRRGINGINMDKKSIMRVAAEASCDPRTVERFAKGEPVRALVEERIKAAMKKLKIKK